MNSFVVRKLSGLPSEKSIDVSPLPQISLRVLNWILQMVSFPLLVLDITPGELQHVEDKDIQRGILEHVYFFVGKQMTAFSSSGHLSISMNNFWQTIYKTLNFWIHNKNTFRAGLHHADGQCKQPGPNLRFPAPAWICQKHTANPKNFHSLPIKLLALFEFVERD